MKHRLSVFGSALIIGVAALIGPMAGYAIAAPVLIPGVQEPEEMRVEPFPVTVPSEPVKLLAEAIQNFRKTDSATWASPLNRILARFPDFADAYAMRATLSLCEVGDTTTALSDIATALKSADKLSVKDSGLSLLSMRAKIQYMKGDYSAALDDLEKAIRSDLTKATEFTNSGGVKPEKTAAPCVWTESDMDALVRRFPVDYRAYLLRGLYFGFFATSDENSIKPAIDNLNKATELNTRSPLPHLFKAKLLGHVGFFKRIGWDDAQRNTLDSALRIEYDKVLTVDPNLLPALHGRAEARFSLRQFQGAIADYDKIVSLDPLDAGAFNDRGLANMQIGRDYEAIADLSEAIKLKSRGARGDGQQQYENRADGYMKTQQWDLAIRDLTTVISFEVGRRILVFMNINQFRAIYPEYKAVSNEAVARKLHQTFWPNLKYEDFSDRFLSDDNVPDFILSDLYLKRSDAYLKKGNWHRASKEFRRAMNGHPDYASAVDRWREIGRSVDAKNYLDMKTFDDARSDSIKLWVKQADGSDESAGPYSLTHFEVNCSARRMRALSSANYNASGQLSAARDGGIMWAAIIPETLGEMLYIGACQAS